MAIIKPATPADAAGIAYVHIESWRTTYRALMPDEVLARRSLREQEASWNLILRQPKRTTTVVAQEQAGGAIVGFASFGPEPGNDYRYQGELYAIYILEAHHHKGIGRMLMSTAAQGLLQRDLPNMLLWVLSSNPARGFYEHLGGRHLRDRSVDFEGTHLQEAAYGWPDLHALASELGSVGTAIP